MSEDLGLQAVLLYEEGSTFKQIGEKLDISSSKVGKLIKRGIGTLRNNNSVLPVLDKGELGNEPENKELILPVLDQEYDYDGILEKSFLVKATPILRKVALNPRIFFYFEYAKKKFGWVGDIGDFLVECVEDFWKNKGYSIRIVYDEELVI